MVVCLKPKCWYISPPIENKKNLRRIPSPNFSTILAKQSRGSERT